MSSEGNYARTPTRRSYAIPRSFFASGPFAAVEGIMFLQSREGETGPTFVSHPKLAAHGTAVRSVDNAERYSKGKNT
jgi:hypothetical protein